MKKISILLSLFFVICLTVNAGAFTFNVAGVWSNLTRGGLPYNEDWTTYNEDHSEVRWGVPVYKEQSGLSFDGNDFSGQSIGVGEQFILGDLTHYNHTIKSGTSAYSAALSIFLTFSDPLFEDTFDFTFKIKETLNAPGPPASDDHIIFSGLDTFEFETFTLGDVDYVLELLGFKDADGNIINQFDSPEGQNNSAQLFATIKTSPAAVPEPAAIFILSSGLLSLGIYKRKKKLV